MTSDEDLRQLFDGFGENPTSPWSGFGHLMKRWFRPL